MLLVELYAPRFVARGVRDHLAHRQLVRRRAAAWQRDSLLLPCHLYAMLHACDLAITAELIPNA